jgi:hypothetical protein
MGYRLTYLAQKEKGDAVGASFALNLYLYFQNTKLTPFTMPTFQIFYFLQNQSLARF